MIRCFVGYYGNEPCYEWRETDEEIAERERQELEVMQEKHREIDSVKGVRFTSASGIYEVVGMEDETPMCEWVDVKLVSISDEYKNKPYWHYEVGEIFEHHIDRVLNDAYERRIDK